MFSYILFDLDGTISDPKLGITSCVQYALRCFGIDEPNPDKLEPFIGPPLRDSFMQFYGFSPRQAQEAINKYRERFSAVGKFENEIYPGIPELLRDLKTAGAHLAIASSKPGVYVEEILNYFGIRQYFDIVVGSELNGTREKKEEVLAEVMRQLALRGAHDAADVVMVGDRRFDVEGAKSVGAHSVAVTYGYAQPGELEASGADIVVSSVEEMRNVLLGNWNRAGQQAYRAHGMNGAAACDNQAAASGYSNQAAASGNSRTAFRHDSRAKRGLRALGMSALAMGLYLLVNMTVATIVYVAGLKMTMFQNVGEFAAEDYWLNMGNAAGILAAFAACAGVWHKMVQLRPVRRIDTISLIPLAILSASMAMGLNGAISLVELYKYSPAFQEVAALQTQTPLWLGILSFGILAPLGEELVFRGVVYGNLKKVFPTPAAILLSGLVFGVFHGNLVQGVYATILGAVLAWAYELYGTILVPMGMHAIANLFVYLLLDCTEFGAVFVTPLPCIFMLFTAAVSLVLMVRWQTSANKIE